MTKGTTVTWQIDKAPCRGRGITISDEENGNILVAVDTLRGEPFPGYHQVIFCSVTWLSVEFPGS